VPRPFIPYAHIETFATLQAWCKANRVMVNSYSPFGGNGNAGKTFSNPAVKAIAAAHNVSAAQAVLRWNVQQGIPVIPMATTPDYQAENLDIFGFNLTPREMECMTSLDASVCPPPPPPPPLTPAQAECTFTLKKGSGGAGGTIVLKALPKGPFGLKDRIGDPYAVTSPCSSVYSQQTASPAVEDASGAQIPLGFLRNLTTSRLPTHLVEKGGMRLILGGGGSHPGCPDGRILQYDMVCDEGAPATAPPNATVGIYDSPARKVDPIPGCTYVVEWHHPAACRPPTKADDETLGSPPRASPRTPHLVVVLGDDFGTYNAGAYRGGRIPTPTIDGLVEEGLLMDSFYVFQICSPTRSSLVSGRYPHHVSQSLPEGFHAISRSYELLPALLKRSASYASYHVGKWHMGFYNESYTPHGQGFDHSFGFLCACHDVNHWDEGGHFTTTSACTGQDIWTERGPAIGKNGSYSAELYGAAAVEFVHQHALVHAASQPMYLHVEYFVPHAPTNPGPPSRYITPLFITLEDRVCANYSGMVVSMDEALGNLTQAIRAESMWQDTLLVLFGDNGGAVPDGGRNWPLRGSSITSIMIHAR
jgi:hypothetical protein